MSYLIESDIKFKIETYKDGYYLHVDNYEISVPDYDEESKNKLEALNKVYRIVSTHIRELENLKDDIFEQIIMERGKE